MPRQTITFSDPNHDWLQQKVDSKEFRNHTEAVNDALRKVREMESGIDASPRPIDCGRKLAASPI